MPCSPANLLSAWSSCPENVEVQNVRSSPERVTLCALGGKHAVESLQLFRQRQQLQLVGGDLHAP
jgi:hypothetical protein